MIFKLQSNDRNVDMNVDCLHHVDWLLSFQQCTTNLSMPAKL